MLPSVTCVAWEVFLTDGSRRRRAGRAFMQRLFQRVEHEIGVHRTTDPPADDAPGKPVDVEGHLQPALPSRDMGEVRAPELIGSMRLELPVDQSQRAGRPRGRDQRAYGLAAPGTAQHLAAHQPLDATAGHHDSRGGSPSTTRSSPPVHRTARPVHVRPLRSCSLSSGIADLHLLPIGVSCMTL